MIPVTVKFTDGGAGTLDMVRDAVAAYLVEEAPTAKQASGTLLIDDVPEDQRDRARQWYTSGIERQLQDLRDAHDWPDGHTDERGRGWEKLCSDVALKMQRYGAAIGIDAADLFPSYLEAAPRGGYVTDHWLATKWSSQTRPAETKGPWPLPADFGRGSAMEAMFADLDPAPASPGQPVRAREEVNVSNQAFTYEWLRKQVGTHALSGIYTRGGSLVFTPRVGSEGYIDGAAGSAYSISVLSDIGLVARIQNRYEPYREDEKTHEKVRAIFPVGVARLAVSAPDELVNAHELAGVVHSPIVRADGSILDAPGYDHASGILYLPEGTPVPPLSHTPTPADIAEARKIIDYMLTDFAFVTEGDRANYIGAMLTPLLRLSSPPPYKMCSIEAHQPGSGKSFLGRALISLHGGTERGEIPMTDEEIGKQIGAILDTSTGGVVMFDNVSGIVRSPALASLLTQPRFTTRRLGTNQQIDVPNDRLWVMTANNAQLGGDLARRVVKVLINPDVPNPERRTDFVIHNWERWVREQRHWVLWALLTMTRAWYAAGAPRHQHTADSYADWISTIDGILRTSGYAGFDLVETRSVIEDADADELATFMHAARDIFGDEGWTVKQLLSRITGATDGDTSMFFPEDALPEYILAKRTGVPTTMSKSLGRWVARNKGRWADNMSIVEDGTLHRAMRWRVKAR